MTIRRKLDFGVHAARPFGTLPDAALVAPRRDLAMAHARIALAEARSDNADFTRKQTEVLGAKVSFFTWGTLHFLFDEIFLDPCYAFDADGDSPRIIDAGGNIGMATLWFALAFPKATMTTIEPDPATFEVLTANVEDNDLGDRVTLVQAALASDPGSIEFMVDPAGPGGLDMSTDARRMPGLPVTVPAMRLSDLIDGPVDLLKIDVEGAEHDVVSEIASSGALAAVRAISMEYHHHIDPSIDRLSEMLALLERNGFGYHLSSSRMGQPLNVRSATAFQDIAVRAVRRPS